MGFVAVPHGWQRGEQAMSRTLLPAPCPLLATERIVSCVLVWGAQPWGGWSAPCAPPLFQKPVTRRVAVPV